LEAVSRLILYPAIGPGFFNAKARRREGAKKSKGHKLAARTAVVTLWVISDLSVNLRVFAPSR
jgi:hypothetical protein